MKGPSMETLRGAKLCSMLLAFVLGGYVLLANAATTPLRARQRARWRERLDVANAVQRHALHQGHVLEDAVPSDRHRLERFG